MREGCFLGIDTSNYTTSLALCLESGEVIANHKLPLPVKAGERGLRQSDAVFHHTRNLPLLFNEAGELFERYRPLAVGVSATPRTQQGSYMPCFLSGVAVAEAIAKTQSLPCYRFSHQNGHIMAAVYSGRALPILGKDFFAFHVSGGTTEVLSVHADGVDFRCDIVGGTKDINAGQAIDRIGVSMGLPFPCGRELEALALTHEGKVRSDRVCTEGAFCNLSGLENRAASMLAAGESRAAVAAYVFDYIGRTLCAMTEAILGEQPKAPIVYSGGVMSCSILKCMLAREHSYFAEPAFSADNAAGIACLAARRYAEERRLEQ